MAVSLSVSVPKETFLCSSFLPQNPYRLKDFGRSYSCKAIKKPDKISFSVSCSSVKIVRSPLLDNHVVKNNRIRFIQKLKTLLLSKPKHFMSIHNLSKCRSYLALQKPRSILSMIHRYPTIFEFFYIPTPPIPANATKPYTQLCVRLTAAAKALAIEEAKLKSEIAVTLANKLQKLLMLTPHHRLLLSKLVHLGPDLGLPPNFRSRLCNDYPDKFKIIDTSYGRALELVKWDPVLAIPVPVPEPKRDLIVDRPLKFKQLTLRKGLNLKKRQNDFLIKFSEVPGVCPYNTSSNNFVKGSMEEEKRACMVAREVLSMMVEKRTLIDHLTHFRKEFNFSNKLRAMLVRHPELFYVSLKGDRDSVFLAEAFDDKGVLLEKDNTSVIKHQLIRLVNLGKKMRRERRQSFVGAKNKNGSNVNKDADLDDDHSSDYDEDYVDGFENLFDDEDEGVEYRFEEDVEESSDLQEIEESGDFWTAIASSAATTSVEESYTGSW